MATNSIQLPLFDSNKESEVLPHPIRLAKQYGFQLRFKLEYPEEMYCIQDWIMGIASCDSRKAQQLYDKMQLSLSIRQLPIEATNRKVYQLDHTDQWGLYAIAQHMRTTKTRPILQKVKDYLVSSGVFVDAIVTNKNDTRGQLQDALAGDNPERGLSASITAYEQKGKKKTWIARRVKGIEVRTGLTQTLADTSDSTPAYAAVTDTGYYEALGMVKRELVKYLGLSDKEAKNLRDYLGEIALMGIGMYELAADKKMQQLGRKLTPDEQIDIVRFCARSVAPTIDELSRYLVLNKIDDTPLLR